ncbi:sulfite exporter TauE/SafE family protein [Herbaspirillum sp. RTI4]|uniref:sulfite exporter TauE/SafE family protein n=1 Tax=Herbaspirillum sp. RTI4 TaxID=3048640 RepID=UPI002AB57822|nr:sulfite exporter TauE/SafE family protein [Herbaspirillum sp. RTI4]MDY7578990.1 sulfite exporter TauE/SafE family protein [Herbaspirillum sp. RTI4]MEA9980921.1 sulfite exporter TauE/SafE family protein [Herbaspirillum sp. RTI4]
MNVVSLLPVFMIGLLGSVHCVGMCGGIVSAFSFSATSRRTIPIKVVNNATNSSRPSRGNLPTVLAYNAGRIASYATAGAIAGGVLQGARTLTGIAVFQVEAYWFVNLLLVALGLYLTGIWQGLNQLERVGGMLWRYIQPFTRFLLPINSIPKSMALGVLWGWLPCGMVYSMLLTAMLSGTAVSGAAVMVAFGLGTLPTLITMGMLGTRLKSWMQRRAVRVISGLVIVIFGVLGLLRASHGLPGSWMDAVCITPMSVQTTP